LSEIAGGQADNIQKRTLHALRPENQKWVATQSRNHPKKLYGGSSGDIPRTAMLLSVLLLPLCRYLKWLSVIARLKDIHRRIRLSQTSKSPWLYVTEVIVTPVDLRALSPLAIWVTAGCNGPGPNRWWCAYLQCLVSFAFSLTRRLKQGHNAAASLTVTTRAVW
jgi:hypothetical protein